MKKTKNLSVRMNEYYCDFCKELGILNPDPLYQQSVPSLREYNVGQTLMHLHLQCEEPIIKKALHLKLALLTPEVDTDEADKTDLRRIKAKGDL